MRPFSQPFLTISKPVIRTCVNLEIFVQCCQVIHLLLPSFSFFSFIFCQRLRSHITFVVLLIRPSPIRRKFRFFIQKIPREWERCRFQKRVDLLTCSWHQKNTKPRIHQFTNLNYCKKTREPFKPLWNGVLFLIYYYKIIFSVAFSF